ALLGHAQRAPLAHAERVTPPVALDHERGDAHRGRRLLRPGRSRKGEGHGKEEGETTAHRARAVFEGSGIDRRWLRSGGLSSFPGARRTGGGSSPGSRRT